MQKKGLALRKSKGFTLIELIITLSLITFVITIIVTILINSSNTYTFVSQQKKITDESDFAIQSINSFIRSSKNVVSQYSYNSVNYSLSDSTLILNLPSINNSGDIIISENDVAIFNLDNGSLRQIIIPSQSSIRPQIDKTITGDVEQLTFDINNINNVVFISTFIKVEKVIEGNINSFSINSGEILYNT